MDEDTGQLDELARWADKLTTAALKEGRKAGLEDGQAEGRAAALQERQVALERNIASYHAAILDEEGEETGLELCAAPAPDVLHEGQPVTCQREVHEVALYERHKAVFGEPHTAVVWNEPEDANG